MKKLAKIRDTKMKLQTGLCHYCGQPMWRDDPEKFRKHHSLPRKRAAIHRCTAEHLTARCDGGKDKDDNIVAACQYCNSRRHMRKNPVPPERYRELVRSRLKQRKWHGFLAAPV